MTDDTPDTELISAYLDGEATAEEVARVEEDPSLLARVAELEALQGRLAVGGPPRGLVDDHVNAALAAFDEKPAAERSPAPVTDLGARRRPFLQRIPLGAVAAVVLLIALVGALSQIDTGDGDDTATAANEATSDDDSDDAGAGAVAGDGTADELLEAESDAAEDATGFSERGGVAPYFLAFSDLDDLADHLAEGDDDVVGAEPDSDAPDTRSTAERRDRDVDPCDAMTIAGVDPSTVTVVFPAVVAGERVTALVIETDGRRMVVVHDGSCTVIDDRAL